MKKKLRIYTDAAPLASNNLKNLSPPLAFHWRDLAVEEIRAGAGREDSPLELTDRPEEADWFVLPMHWTYYLWNGKANMKEAARLAGLAREHGKRLIVWFKGDLVPVVPFDHALVFLPGIVKSSARPNHRACPVFVEDPLPKFGTGRAPYREKRDKPTIGFCGYAESGAVKTLWSVFKGAQLNLQSRLGRYDYEAVPLVPATLKRARALELLARAPQVETDFVIRDQFCAERMQSKFFDTDDKAGVFYANIFETDYTLCLRGYGNWSYRFYETLACGRIPVFIDTDCALPAETKIDWKQYCVWVDQSELKQIGEKVADFHASLSPEQFLERQRACRRLWEEWLTPRGFMEHFPDYL